MTGSVELDQDGMRADLYGLLASLLSSPPSADLLKLIGELEVDTTAQSDLAFAWKLLVVAAGEANVDEVDDEYHALFIGLGRGEIVPFGSWYLTGYLMDRPLVYLRRDLAELGIERQDGVHEPEDHAAILCESMRVIITADDINTERQRRFHQAHMGTWMQVFFKELQQAESACFYVAVGRLGEAFMQFEERYLDLPR